MQTQGGIYYFPEYVIRLNNGSSEFQLSGGNYFSNSYSVLDETEETDIYVYEIDDVTKRIAKIYKLNCTFETTNYIEQPAINITLSRQNQGAYYNYVYVISDDREVVLSGNVFADGSYVNVRAFFNKTVDREMDMFVYSIRQSDLMQTGNGVQKPEYIYTYDPVTKSGKKYRVNITIQNDVLDSSLLTPKTFEISGSKSEFRDVREGKIDDWGYISYAYGKEIISNISEYEALGYLVYLDKENESGLFTETVPEEDRYIMYYPTEGPIHQMETITAGGLGWNWTPFTKVSEGKYTLKDNITTYNLTVTDDKVAEILPSSLELQVKEITVAVDDSVLIETRVLPENATNPSLRWISEDSTVAVVLNGRVYGVKEGTTTIKVSTINGIEKTVSVTVTKKTEETLTLKLTEAGDSGITVSGTENTIPKNAILKVESVSEGNMYETIQKLADTSNIVLFDIKLVDSMTNRAVQPNGFVKVSIPIPAQFVSQTNLTVFYYNDVTGKIKDMKAVIEDGYLSFYTNHFSAYFVGNTDEVKVSEEMGSVVEPDTDEKDKILGGKEETNQAKSEETAKQNATTASPKTGDTSRNTIIFLGMAMISFLIIAIILKKKLHK